MNACPYLLILGLGLAILPANAPAQSGFQAAAYHYDEGGTAISSNVPLNEINTHAYRNFQRLFSSGISGEYWYSSTEGYQVSFLSANGRHCQAFFDRHGAYRYSLQYYPGKEIPRVAGDPIKAKYPDYQIDVVTEITDGEKTFYLVKIISSSSIKTLSVDDSKIAVLDELINGLTASAGTTSQQSYP